MSSAKAQQTTAPVKVHKRMVMAVNATPAVATVRLFAYSSFLCERANKVVTAAQWCRCAAMNPKTAEALKPYRDAASR